MPLTTFDRFTGLNTVDDHVRIKPRERAIAFTQAVNVDIDKTFKPSRRDGKEKKASGDFGSMWTGGVTLAVKDGNLVSINPETFAVTLLRAGVGTSRMYYAEIGDKVYFSNGTIIGYAEDGVTYDIPAPTIEFKRVMPAGGLLTFFKGRLLIAKDSYIFYSDVADYNQYDGRSGILQFKSDVALIAPVNDGFFVSDSSGTYFMRGTNPEKWTKERVADYGAKKMPPAKIRDMRLGDYTVGNPVMWLSQKGLCVGGDGGFFKNLTESKYKLPVNVQQASGAFISRQGLNQFIGVVRA